MNDKTNEAAQTVLTGLKKLEYRGYDSWGVAIKPSSGKFVLVEKKVGKIGLAKTTLPHGTVAIGHTRWATHGGVTDANAHPHLDCTKEIAVLHNGIVENYQELKVKLLEEGHLFVSETDTEIIAHLIEEKLKTRALKNAVFDTFKELVGSNAIAILHGPSETIIACRNGSPLVVGIGKKDAYVASDVPAFLKFTNNVHFLADGESVVLNAMGVMLFDTESANSKKFSWEELDWKQEDAEKGGYPHFLLKEVMDQIKTIPQAFLSKNESIVKIAEKLQSGFKPIFIGCGSAYYCALAAHYKFALSGIDSVVVGGYEYQPFASAINDKSIIFAISQSGETADTLIPVKDAKKKGATIVAVVNARGSSLERLADITLSVNAGPEIAVVSTKAYTAQLATLYAIAHQHSNAKSLLQYNSKLKQWLNEDLMNKVLAVAKEMIGEEHAYVIGKYINYPAALEFALKLKETSYIHAEAFAAGELKHGVITLIQKGTPCFVLTDSGVSFHEIRSSAAQMKARGGHIVGVGSVKAPEFDEWIQTPDAGPEYSIFYNVIVGQLLGYYLGVGRGTDPDKPRNLAKSVTVK